jgi:ABC-2 type transport system ATP-binding protein
MTSAITVHDLRMSYRNLVALDGVDLDVTHGEVFALLGPNGAGKTTTIEILEGHRSRDSGDVAVLGYDPGHAGDDFRARIGIVGQSQAGALDELSVDEVVRHFAHYYPRPRDPAELIDLVGLDEKRSARVRQLSGGQRRRLDVALGVIGNPELLFLDEPTTGFDPEARRKFWGLVRNLADMGTTVLLTTHYLDEAEALSDRLAVIAGGRIVARGTAATIGDRTSASATVSWREGDATRSVHSHEPTKVVTDLAQRFDGEVPELTVSRPTLEDVYLQLIGADS